MRATGHRGFLLLLTLACILLPCATSEPPAEAGEKRALPRLEADQGVQFMLSLYRRAADADGRPRELRMFGCNTVRLVRPSASRRSRASASPDQRHTYTLDFNMNVFPKERLIRATMVHLRSSALADQPLSCEVRVCSSEGTSRGVISQRTLMLSPWDQWAETDISPLISVQSGGSLSLIIQYWCMEGGLLKPLKIGGIRRQSKRGSTRRPFSSRAPFRVPALLLYLEEDMHPKDWVVPTGAPALLVSGRTRRRRSKEPGSIGSDIPNYIREGIVAKNQCKLHSYRVTFRDLGWDHWIIAPHTYNPRYCKGDCPRVLHYGYNAPNHAIVQNFINEIMAGEVPPPSCVPYKYKPISVLMMEKNGSVTYKEYEDMIAESCTCR